MLTFMVYKDGEDKFRWKLETTEICGKLVGMSYKSFDTQRECEDNFDLIRQAKVQRNL